MFTGIVEEIGRLKERGTAAAGAQFSFACRNVLEGTALGDSIAVNGVCLTVTDLGQDWFRVGVAPETLRRSNLGQLKPGQPVNLERALTPNTRMGGHFVQGHVDGTATIIERRPEQESLWLRFRGDRAWMALLVPKGFVCVDGISLTLVDVDDDTFSLMLVAYTQAQATLAEKSLGAVVNIEVDILGKYVARLLGAKQAQGIDMRRLERSGFV